MLKQKCIEWLKRYLPAEIVCTITAVLAASITHVFSNNYIFIAYIGSLGEAIGFYSTVFIQNILIVNTKCKSENKLFSFSDFIKIITDIVLEFGLAGIIDGLLLRPLFMYLFPILLNGLKKPPIIL